MNLKAAFALAGVIHPGCDGRVPTIRQQFRKLCIDGNSGAKPASKLLGPPWRAQYHSAIFYSNDDQKRVAEAYIKQLNDAHVFSRPIVTQVVSLKGFYPAEAYHQGYLHNNMTNPYIIYNDLPKLAALKKQYPQLCKR